MPTKSSLWFRPCVTERLDRNPRPISARTMPAGAARVRRTLQVAQELGAAFAIAAVPCCLPSHLLG